jgi:Flp pilus assembly secretin CpaC
MIPRVLAVAAALVLMLGTARSSAQQPAKPPAKTTVTALMVEVTVSRYQGDKRISSLPYSISVTPDGNRANLRVGGDVAIPTTTFTPVKPATADAAGADAKEAKSSPSPLTSYSYRSIGTSIDVSATPTEDDRYKVSISLDESSVYPPGEAAKNMNVVGGAPAFRSLKSSNTLTLRDGQSVDYTAATDRITGEVARISVKLTVIN